VAENAGQQARVFKSAWFARASRKTGIDDEELCAAIRQVILGQVVDLGGGVFKKRMDKNRSRAIILAKSGRRWIYEYLFAKKDRDNISKNELSGFRVLASSYETLTDQQVNQLILKGDWVEICDGAKEVQERCV
jgi:hypothetical protein